MKTINRLIIATTFCSTLIGFTACETNDEQELEERNWQLVWSDEFNGALGSAPDSSNWNYDIGNGTDGWGNQELQSYRSDSANIAMDGEGSLIIRALRNGNAFTSARINTQGKFSQELGRFEARMKTPYGPGIWPAFWLLSEEITTVGWPQCGEIDIMELRGQAPHIMASAIHGPGYSAGNAISKSFALTNDRFDNDFHIFAVEWFEDRLDFFVDDFLYHRIERADFENEWVFDSPFFIIMNIAVGGTYVGFPVDGTPFPQSFYIDYVRVYKAA